MFSSFRRAAACVITLAAAAAVVFLPAASFAQQPGGNADVQRQIDDLRQIITRQQQQVDRLREQVSVVTASVAAPQREPAERPPTTPVALTVASRAALDLYGFLRLDTIVDSGLTNNAQSPFFVQSPSNANVVRTSNTQLAIHPRLTRLGINYAPTPGVATRYNRPYRF